MKIMIDNVVLGSVSDPVGSALLEIGSLANLQIVGDSVAIEIAPRNEQKTYLPVGTSESLTMKQTEKRFTVNLQIDFVCASISGPCSK